MQTKIYPSHILEHYHKGAYRGRLEESDFSSTLQHPSCGDEIIFTGMLNNNMLTKVLFDGQGCILSQAAASMLAHYAQGKSKNDVLEISETDIESWINLPLGPQRVRCITLPLQALKQALVHKKVCNA